MAPKDTYNISQATAQWLLQFCTKLVRLGIGQNWKPIGQETLDPSNGYIDGIHQDPNLPPHIKDWIGGLLIVCKTIAGIIAYQYQPEEVPPLLDRINDIDYGVAGFDDFTEIPDIDNLEMINK